MAKVDKKVLGTGMARRAADALSGRAAKLKAAEDEATGRKSAKGKNLAKYKTKR